MRHIYVPEVLRHHLGGKFYFHHSLPFLLKSLKLLVFAWFQNPRVNLGLLLAWALEHLFSRLSEEGPLFFSADGGEMASRGLSSYVRMSRAKRWDVFIFETILLLMPCCHSGQGKPKDQSCWYNRIYSPLEGAWTLQKLGCIYASSPAFQSVSPYKHKPHMGLLWFVSCRHYWVFLWV